MDKILPNGRWNFYLKDYGKIMPIDSKVAIVLQIINLLNINKFTVLN